MVQVRGWEDDRLRGPVQQVAQTYSVVGLMNEHQLSLGETTTGGRRELVDRKGMLDYDALMLLTLQRAKTAREAIKVIDELAREYGYQISGETFSIADKNEAWIMELIGKGPGQKGIVWVAARVPDGMITAHANMSRITTFPLNDPENWLYSPDVISFAIEKRFYSTDSQQAVQLSRCLPSRHRRLAEAGLCRPGLEHLPPVARNRSTSPTPTSAEGGSRRLSAVHQARCASRCLRRDGLDARPLRRNALRHDQGARRRPVRHARTASATWRSRWMARDYMWERPISTQQAGFVVVTQSRKGMPDAVGGVTWFTPDEASTSCFTPLYCGITAFPGLYVEGRLQEVRVGLGLVGVEPGLEPLLRPLVADRPRRPSRARPSARPTC